MKLFLFFVCFFCTFKISQFQENVMSEEFKTVCFGDKKENKNKNEKKEKIENDKD